MVGLIIQGSSIILILLLHKIILHLLKIILLLLKIILLLLKRILLLKRTQLFLILIEIIRKINQLLVDEIEIEENQIYPAADLKKDLGIDSLDFVDLFVIIERNFGVKMKAEEMADIKSLQDFYDYIINRVRSN